MQPFMDKHSWEGKSYSSGAVPWKRFQKKKSRIALNILHTKSTKKCVLSTFQNTG